MNTKISDPIDFLKEVSVKKEDVNPQAPEKKEDKSINNPPKEEEKDKGVGALRKERDEYKKRVTELEEKISKEYEPVKKLEPLKKIGEYIERKFESVSEETVDKFINNSRERKKKLTDLEKNLTESEIKLRETNITQSELWKNEYEAPIIESKNALFATISNLDNEGNVKNEELIKTLATSLCQTDKEGKTLDHIKIKSIITKFSDIYRKETGEEYEIPDLARVKETVNNFVNKYKDAAIAKQNWESKLEEKKKQDLLKLSEKQKAAINAENEAREYYTNELITNFDYKNLEGVFNKEDIILKIKEEHKYYTEASKDPAKRTREYKDHIEICAKGAMFDSILEKLKTTQDLLNKEIEKNNSSLPNGGTKPDKKSQPSSSLGKNEDPTSIFK